MKAPLIVFVSVSSVLLAAESQAPAPADVAVKYKELIRATKEPKQLGGEATFGCRSYPEIAAERKRLGPHAGERVYYYRSKSAVQPTKGPWPVGSVIVKEKLGAGEITIPGVLDKAQLPAVPTAISGMIKRPAGTSPKTGNWEYFWWENGKLSTNSTAHCAGCHSGAARDSVFTDFNSLAAAEKAKK